MPPAHVNFAGRPDPQSPQSSRLTFDVDVFYRLDQRVTGYRWECVFRSGTGLELDALLLL